MNNIVDFQPGPYVVRKLMKHKEHRNFREAHQSGAIKTFEDRWNGNYFQRLGLQIRIEPPRYDLCDMGAMGAMGAMDVATSKLFRYQHEAGIPSHAPGRISIKGSRKENRYQYREKGIRGEALRKGRIIILPFDTNELVSSQMRTASEGHNGQSAIRATTMARPSFQHLASGHRSEDNIERAPSPDLDTFWGGCMRWGGQGPM